MIFYCNTSESCLLLNIALFSANKFSVKIQLVLYRTNKVPAIILISKPIIFSLTDLTLFPTLYFCI